MFLSQLLIPAKCVPLTPSGAKITRIFTVASANANWDGNFTWSSAALRRRQARANG